MISKNKKHLITLILLLCALMMGAVLACGVAAEESEEVSMAETSRESRIGQSPLVEEANSRAAEEARRAAEDTSSGLLRFIRDTSKNISNSFNRNFIANNGWKLLLKGLRVTLQITFFATIVGIILGFFIGLVRSVNEKADRFRILNAVTKFYITIIRGTPVVVQLLIINFVIFQSVNINKVLVAVIAFGINSGAYVAEIFRSGIMSIDNGQTEAGRSLGLTYSQTMRLIIMPQAIKNVLPTLGNEFIVLLKETSVASFIAVQDLTRAGYIIQGTTYDAFWPLIGVAAIYLVVVMGLTRLLTMLERRLRRSDNR